MCGIVGLIKKEKVNKSDIITLETLNNALRHRGPDDAGSYNDNNVILMMRRLSIVGLSNGKQPFFSKDKKIIGIVNGEIYNYAELKAILKKKNLQLKTKSDCEVIIGLYQLFGNNFVKYLTGMFAISIYDKAKNKLILVRDRMGEKPIYYYNTSKILIFSSELRNIIKYPAVKKDLDPEAINQYFHIGNIIEPRTPFKNVKKLEAGSILEVNIKTLEKKLINYWDINKIKRSKKKININEILASINKANQEVMNADVKVALAYSGGIDSHLIYSDLIKEKKNFSSINIQTEKNDDTKIIKKIHKANNINFFCNSVSDKELIKNFNTMVLARDEPVADISGSNYFELMRFAKKKNFKVIIFGHGGDELFWGYKWYNQSALITSMLNKNKFLAFFFIWKFQIAKIQSLKAMVKSLFNFFEFFTSIKIYLNSKKKFSNKKFLSFENNAEFQMFEKIKYSFFQKEFSKKIKFINPCDELYKKYVSIKKLRVFFLNLILKTYMLTNGILQNDRLSMSSGVEVRLPFMSHKVVEKVVKHEMIKETENFSKDSFIRAVGKKTKKDIKNYKKEGFNTPANWTSLIYEKYKDLLKNGYLVKLGIMNSNFKNFSGIKLKVIILELWLRDTMR